MWTEDEVELLLNVAPEFRVNYKPENPVFPVYMQTVKRSFLKVLVLAT